MPDTSSSLTQAWARQLLSLDPTGSPQVMEAARRGLTDYLACALGGADDPGLDRVAAALAPATGAATVIARGQTLDAVSAALLNGYSGHALDYDDVHRSVRGHPSTVLLPALLALAQTRGMSGQKLLGAYAVGAQAMGRLGLAIGGAHYEAGFHNTATLGTIATAAACGWGADHLAALRHLRLHRGVRARGRRAAPRARGVRLRPARDAGERGRHRGAPVGRVVERAARG